MVEYLAEPKVASMVAMMVGWRAASMVANWVAPRAELMVAM